MQIVASIVLYRHTQTDIEPTLASLLSEETIEKIVLVDNGGADWAANLNHPRIEYIQAGSNLGFGAGHNIAIKKYLSRSEYFLICNPDIRFQEGAVSSLYQVAKKNKYKFLSPSIVYSDGSKQFSCRLLPTPVNLFARRFIPALAKDMDKKYELRNADFSKVFTVPSVSGCFMFLESELLARLEGFDDRYFMYMEDIDLCRRALKYTDIIYYSDVTITHLFKKGSYESKYLLLQHILSSIKYFNKWGWFFDPLRRSKNKECLKSVPIKANT
ncbi:MULTISPECIES: glycosyltransferase [Pantoea]|uniref:glycosyltransferase n=1 Tax=Pantoea TaxID=53335 RepID=UPI001F3CE910|nr:MULTISPECIES: glycosyltransferase family 2 protein [Pantoea]MCT2418318.1 glycosyltransferase family 2 protein [Pantoea sp. XY16]